MKKKREACPQETRTTVRVPHLKKWQEGGGKKHRHDLKDNVYRLLQTPVRQDRRDLRMKMRVRRPIITRVLFSSLSFSFPAQDVSSGGSAGGFPRFLCAFLNCCRCGVTAQTSNDAGRFGPYCELFFFLIRHEPGDGEAAVCSPVGLHGNMCKQHTIHNGTFAPFSHSRTRGHAFMFLALLMPSRFIFAP